MKLWMRYGAGIVLGIVLGLLLPADAGGDGSVMAFLAELALNIGRYALLPLLFFLIPVSVFSMLEDKKLLRVMGRTVLYSLAAAAAGVFLGGLMVLVLAPQRIPIIMAETAAPDIPGLQDVLLQVFPANAAQAFMSSGAYLLPVAVLSLLLGFGFAASHSFSSPVLDFFDSAARLLYTVNGWIVSVLGLAMIPVTAVFLLQLRGISEFDLFAELLFAVLFGAGLVLLIGIPLGVFLLGSRHNPVAFLFAVVPPAAAAAVSGNHMFALAVLMRTGRNNQGVSRKAESVVFSITTLFSRAGTALVAMIAFVVVLRSYSSLEISMLQVLGVGMSAAGISFLLGTIPGADILVFLSLLSGLHGRGIPEGYLILLPLVPVLVRIGAVVDIVTAAAIAQIVGLREKMCKDVATADFI